MTTPTEVEARFAEDGQVTLLSFTWRGRRQPVASHGRQWRAEDGRHYLVMTPAEEVFELVFVPLTGLWHIAQAPSGSLTA
jgi:hypothetical protein